MHMADALISPAVGGAMTAVSAIAIGYSVKKIAGDKLDERKIPMMGVMGALVFAGQMINFTIPATGSSGHIGGGILLAAILGPFPALITLASVLLIQCLFFADGGLLAYGCNVFNMGVCACLIAYPLIFKPLINIGLHERSGGKTGGRRTPVYGKKNIILAAIFAVILGLQLGAFCVVLETQLSGVTELPFGTFILFMQPIHLAIGLVEGIVTAGVLCYVHSVRPELLESAVRNQKISAGTPMKKVLVTFLVLAVFVGGGLSLIASSFPDGLEWSMKGITGSAELERDGDVYRAAGEAAAKTAVMPGYTFTGNGAESPLGPATAGIAGSAITVILAGGAGWLIHYKKKKKLRRVNSDASSTEKVI